MNPFAAGAQSAAGLDRVTQLREDRLMTRAAHLDLQLIRSPRVNLLLVGTEDVIQNALDALSADLRRPTATWRPGEQLVLPPPAQAGTLILRSVGELTPADQRRLLTWLELTTGRAQVVSTTRSALLSHVEAGTFIDTLYYRLNTVVVDVTT